MDNTMQDRVDDYLDQVFSPYEDSPGAAELRIEIRHDLLERLAELAETGVGDEVAYAQAISFVGDLNATLAEIVAAEGTEPGPAVRAVAPTDATPPTAPAGTSTAPADQPAEPRTPEPEGPAYTLPEGDTPGETWSHGPDAQSDTPPRTADDWISDLADAVAGSLDSVRGQVASAMEQVNEALASAGLLDESGNNIRPIVGIWGLPDLDRRLEAAARRVRDRGRERNRRTGISYAATTMRNTNFDGQQLANSSFTASSLRGSTFVGAQMQNADLRSCDMRNCDLSQADLTNAVLNSCSLRGARFDRTNLTNASLSHSDVRAVTFTGCSLLGVRATFADFRGTVFADCRLDNATFTGSDLRGARFAGLSLTNVRFDMSNVSDADFSGSTLHQVSFHHVSRRCVETMVFTGTVMDHATYLSLRSSGAEPRGMTFD